MTGDKLEGPNHEDYKGLKKTDHSQDKKHPVHETHSSGPSTDKVNSRQDRLAADPALEPDLARKHEDELAKEAEAKKKKKA